MRLLKFEQSLVEHDRGNEGDEKMSDVPSGGRGKGEAGRIKAEAIGRPGERRFRLMAIIDGETRIVWMEKEQMRRLAEALENVLENLPDRGPASSTQSFSLPEFATDTPHQIRAGRMELGYDETLHKLIIIAHELESTDPNAPAFECLLSPDLARDLVEEAVTVVSAGRPICPLCGRPMGPDDHVCAKQNGHFPHRLEEVQTDEEDEETI